MSAPSTARSFWIREPGHGEILCAELPPRQAGEVLVRACYSGISRGTEALVFRGRGAAVATRGDAGAVSGGRVSRSGQVRLQQRRHRGGGARPAAGPDGLLPPSAQDCYCVPAEAVHPVPAGVPASRAVLAANMETAVNVVWDARPAPGDEILVIGGGVVGLLAASLCRDLPGTAVTVVDPNRVRAVAAAALGLAYRPDPPGDGTAGSGHPRQRTPRRAAGGAGVGRARGDDCRGELVRDDGGGTAARRGVSRPAPDAPEHAGGTCAPGPRAALVSPSAAGAGSGPARR